ncbi:MFS transporter [Streptomyces sp. NBC_00989]|uniref:MFS transporter n=1 Tax=Streptomyces sp. NBC_00989 TaxID=2903705 RepID=UPI00386FF6C3|nr:MFS transporter [Streptomyces sp. NBC_00989]WSW98052.1 MFS transporter [Streptomyces sp. NBC_00989]
MTTDASTTDASARLSPQQFIDRGPMSRRQWLIVILGLLMMVAEGLDAVVAAFVYPKIEKQWGTGDGAVTATVTLSVLAMVLGGAVAGPLADRYGRRGVTAAGIAVFGLGTAGMALTHGIGPFAGVRIVACLGLGAVLPTMMALVADWTPAARRAQMVALAFAGVTAGTTAGGILSSLLIPAHGWPVLLTVCGLLPLLLIPALLVYVPESVSVLAARGRPPAQVRAALRAAVAGRDLTGVDLDLDRGETESRQLPVSRAVLSGATARTTVLLWLCFLTGLGVVGLILSYLPLLAERAGLTSAQAGIAVAAFGWGGLAGQLAVSFVLRRFDRFAVLAALWTAGALGLAAAGLWAPQFAALLAGAFVLGLCLPAANSALQVIAALAYPPSARATGISWANSAGKLGPVLGALAGGLMAQAGWSLGTVLTVLALPLALCLPAVRALRARGRDHRAAEHTAPRPLPAPAPGQV